MDENEYSTAFWKEMEKLRESLGLNIVRFYEIIGMDRVYFYRFKNGKKKSIKLDSLHVLINLGLPITEIGEENQEEFVNRIFKTDKKAFSKFWNQIKESRDYVDKQYTSYLKEANRLKHLEKEEVLVNA